MGRTAGKRRYGYAAGFAPRCCHSLHLPPDLGGSPDDPIEQGRAARIFGRIAQAIGPYFEGAVVIIVLTALYFAIKLTG